MDNGICNVNLDTYTRACGSEFEFDQDGALRLPVMHGDPLAT